MNTAIQNCSFPDELKEADISSILKQDDSSWKGNYRPISILSALSKVYERIIGVQMESHFATEPPHLLSGFRQGYIVLNMPYFVLSNPGRNALMPKALLVLS